MNETALTEKKITMVADGEEKKKYDRMRLPDWISFVVTVVSRMDIVYCQEKGSSGSVSYERNVWGRDQKRCHFDMSRLMVLAMKEKIFSCTCTERKKCGGGRGGETETESYSSRQHKKNCWWRRYFTFKC